MKYLGVASHGDRSLSGLQRDVFGWWGFKWLQMDSASQIDGFFRLFCIMDEKRCLCVCVSIVMLIVETVFSIIPFPHVVSFLICIISALVYDSCMWLFLSTCAWLGLHIPAWNSREVAPDTGAKSRTRLGVGKLRLFWSSNIFVERQDGHIICQAFRPWNLNGQIELGHECV